MGFGLVLPCSAFRVDGLEFRVDFARGLLFV